MLIIRALFLVVKLVGEGIFVWYKNASSRACSRRRIPSPRTNHSRFAKLGRRHMPIPPAFLQLIPTGIQHGSPVQIKLQQQHRQLVRQSATRTGTLDAISSWYHGAAGLKQHEEKKMQQEDRAGGLAGWGRRTAAGGLNGMNEAAGSGFHVAALSALGSSLASTHHGRNQDCRLQGPRRLPHMSPPATISLLIIPVRACGLALGSIQVYF